MNGGDKSLSPYTGASDNGGSIDLPYVIEIWNLGRTEVERIIARADTLQVARALFNTAVSDNPSRRLVLRQGTRVIHDRA